MPSAARLNHRHQPSTTSTVSSSSSSSSSRPALQRILTNSPSNAVHLSRSTAPTSRRVRSHWFSHFAVHWRRSSRTSKLLFASTLALVAIQVTLVLDKQCAGCPLTPRTHNRWLQRSWCWLSLGTCIAISLYESFWQCISCVYFFQHRYLFIYILPQDDGGNNNRNNKNNKKTFVIILTKTLILVQILLLMPRQVPRIC